MAKKRNLTRITVAKVMGIITKNVDSITAINSAKGSLLELVDITIVDDRKDQFPQLDIKIRNIGDRIAVLKRAEIHISKMWSLLDPSRVRVMPISCERNLYHDLHIKKLAMITSITVDPLQNDIHSSSK